MDAPDGGLRDAARLLLKGRAYALCAGLLSDRSPGPTVGESLALLGETLDRLAYRDALASLNGASVEGADPAVEAEYLRLFVKGDVPPYETSYAGIAGAESGAGASAGGNVQQIADVAGFYRAFGLEVRGDRPDHVAAELEFLALLCVKEAHARLSQESEGTAVCLEARLAFLDQHLLPWLSAFENRVGEAARHPVFRAIVGAAHRVAAADRAELQALAPDQRAGVSGGDPG
jgi:TorA maturation chaperone TorD